MMIIATGTYNGRHVDTFFTTGETKAKAVSDAKYYASSRKAQGMVPRGTKYRYKVAKANKAKNRVNPLLGRGGSLSARRKMKSAARKLAAWVKREAAKVERKNARRVRKSTGWIKAKGVKVEKKGRGYVVKVRR